MPMYEYEDPQSGTIVEEIRPIAERDAPCVRDIGGRRVALARVTVPRRLAVVGTRPPPTQGESVLSGYYHEEQRRGNRFRSEFTPREIREAWEGDDGRN